MAIVRREFTLEVIQKYREHPCLWQATHAQFRNTDSRNDALDDFLPLFHSVDRRADRETVERKLGAIRVSYSRDLRRVRASQISECNVLENTSKFWYYEQMSFLRDRDTQNKCSPVTATFDDTSFSNKKKHNFDTNNQTSSKRNDQYPTFRPAKAVKRHQSRTEVINKIVKLEKPEQQIDTFADHVAKTLKSLPASLVPICQKLMNNLLDRACANQINETSRIVTDQQILLTPIRPSSDGILVYNYSL